MQKSKFWFWFIPGVLVTAALMTLAALYDLDINTALYAPTNWFAIWWEAFGYWVAYAPVFFLFFAVAFRPKASRKLALSIPMLVVTVGGYAYLAWDSVMKVFKRVPLTGGDGWRVVVWTAGCVAIYLAMVVAFIRIKPPARAKMEFFGLYGTIFLICSTVIVNVMKAIWQRTRFDDMLEVGSFADFTPWYQPFGNGGSSFPSGHTVNAAAIFMLLILCDLWAASSRTRNLALVFSWLYIAMMGLGRIIIGRHYLSDVVAGGVLMALFFMLMHRLPVYRKNLQKTLDRAGAT